MFTGVESEEEFKHKRPLEYERLVKQGKLEATARRGAADVAGEFLQGGWIHGDFHWADAAGADAERVFQLKRRITARRRMVMQ